MMPVFPAKYKALAIQLLSYFYYFWFLTFMQYIPYIILLVLFALPLLLLLKKQDAFKLFTYRKLVWVLNRAGLVYLLLCIGFAFLFAWLESTYYLDGNGTSAIDITAEVAMGFMMVTLFAFAPLLLILNIIKWCLKKEPAPSSEIHQH
jgi:hypothetical protein